MTGVILERAVRHENISPKEEDQFMEYLVETNGYANLPPFVLKNLKTYRNEMKKRYERPALIYQKSKDKKRKLEENSDE